MRAHDTGPGVRWQPLAPGALRLSPAAIKTLLALCVVYDRDGRATTRAVGAERNLAGIGAIPRHLRRLEAERLIDRGDGVAGALRPLVQIVQVTR